MQSLACCVCLSCSPDSNKSRSADQSSCFALPVTLIQLPLIQGGMEVRFVVGLDFTASNGNPNDPSSKHYFGRKCCWTLHKLVNSIVSALHDKACFSSDHAGIFASRPRV